MPGLHKITATQALAWMVDKKISPVDYLEAILERIEKRETTIKAWVCIDKEKARADAARAEHAYREGNAGPLCGIPIGVKDILLTKNMPTGGNFAPLKDYNPGYDSECVRRLRNAGAIILGKLTTTQFAGRDPTETVNPWNFFKTASGSSSGSAVSVADRMVPVALGTQTGGSVIRPASYMGVVGFVPTFGRVSRHGLLPRSYSFDMIGTMGRCIADSVLIANVMSGPDPKDRASMRPALPVFKSRPKIADSPPSLILFEEFLNIASKEVADCISNTADKLATAGADVRRASLPFSIELLMALHTIILISEASATQLNLIKQFRDFYSPGLLSQLDIGSVIPAKAYLQAQRLRRRVRAEFDKLIGNVDGFLIPSTSELAPDLGSIGPRFCQTPWTILGWPCFNIPAGLSKEGLPIGLQLIGGPYLEDKLCDIATWIESQLDPITAPPDTT